METPETYVLAHTGPRSDIWTEVEGKQLRGLNATGTFEADGSEWQRGVTKPTAQGVFYAHTVTL